MFEWVFLRPLRNADILSTALVTIGLSIFLQNTALVIWGPKPGQVIDPFDGATLMLGDVGVTAVRISLVVAIAAMAALGLLINTPNLAVWCARPSKTAMPRLCKVSRSIASSACPLWSVWRSPPWPARSERDLCRLARYGQYGQSEILRGRHSRRLGNIPGAVAGGFLLGLAESFGAGYISTGYKDGISFLLLIIVLLIGPMACSGVRAQRHERTRRHAIRTAKPTAAAINPASNSSSC